MMKIWFLTLSGCNSEELKIAEKTIAREASSISLREINSGPEWEILLQYSKKPKISELATLLASNLGHRDFKLSLEQDRVNDWVKRYRRDRVPLKTDQFFIYPSHFRRDPPEGFIPIHMDAGLAFGTGDHPTTRGCLHALEQFAADGYKPNTAVDIGCGTGILTIAVRKLWPEATVTATDIDPIAISVSKDNLKHNGVSSGVKTLVLDGWPSGMKFDLCVANILSDPLIVLASKASQSIEQGGRVVLSGILLSQVENVLSAWLKSDFVLLDRLDDGEWTILMLNRV